MRRSLHLMHGIPRGPGQALFESESDAALGEVVGCHFHGHPISGEDPDAVLAHFPGRVRKNFVIIVESHTEHRVRQKFDDCPLKLQKIFFRHTLCSVTSLGCATGCALPRRAHHT